jgi:hypothetical protein
MNSPMMPGQMARGSDDGPGHLADTETGGVESRHSFVHQAVNVLDHHDAVVHEHTERKYQRKEDHHVEGDAQRVQDGETQKHGKGNGHTDKKGVAEPQEEQQDADHEQDAQNDAVLQLIHLGARLVGLVGSDAHTQIGRQEFSLRFFDDAVDFIRGDDEVFSGAFSHIERNHRVAPFAGIAGRLLVHKLNLGDVAQVHGVATFGLDDDGLQVFGVTYVAHDLDSPAAAIHEDVAS